ncbi:pentapeptide repeat-containing protein [Saccharothrix saharensis]|uniref:pentapeptide repeat-containing protein n=1 Tax=Saccharothrix saharensis TaxID=571190 RepID=UPI0014780667|nr:pentapeptide repeat-containing protein [Saccharothrix saharensis]
MPLPTPTTPRTPLEPMPRRVIATVAALIATATIGLVVALWWAGTAGLSGAELVNARFNALRTGLSIGVGGGGIFALYLAWRRQHATEIGLVQKERDQADVTRAFELQRETAEHTRLHAERVAATTERDAEARRITDLYAKSVEQLGSDKAPVRHGGLYALERLAQDHPDNPALRQTVANVLCAYLRTPFDLPAGSLDADADRAARDEHREQVQEREVRLTAQRILTAHLYIGNDPDSPTATFWADVDLDLTAAVLIDWDMNNGKLRNGVFQNSIFVGEARFNRASFTGNVSFSGAKFTAPASFNDAQFTADARFVGATFTETAVFDAARFTRAARLEDATFMKDSSFDKALFREDAWFVRTLFTGQTWFTEAAFGGYAGFESATFARGGRFENAKFSGAARFWNATFSKHAWFNEAEFREDVEFNNAKFDESFSFTKINHALMVKAGATYTPIMGEATFVEGPQFNEAETIDDDSNRQVKITQGVRFDGATFSKRVKFTRATLLHSPVDQAINYSSWPSGWQPSPDHVAIEDREGTWHYLLTANQAPEITQPGLMPAGE